MINYIAWANEYEDEAHKILRNIENKKQKLKTASADEKHTLNADIVRLRNIYYECMLTSKHLRERSGECFDDTRVV